MNPNNYNLCVGGPMDGRITAQEKGFFEVAVIGNLVFTSSLEDADKSVDFKRVRYVFDAIHTPDGDVCLWRPEGQSMLETLRALVTSYCDGKSRG